MYATVDNVNNASISMNWIQTMSTAATPAIRQCLACRSDGRYASLPPYYRLGPAPLPVAPFYNYTLPSVSPPVAKPPPLPIDAREYWYRGL